MSLADPNDEYSELVPSGKNPISKIFSGKRNYWVILLIGIILGILCQYFLVNPLIDEAQNSTCRDCTTARELLNRENECLYKLVPDVTKVPALCGTNAPAVPQGTIPKDFNAE